MEISLQRVGDADVIVLDGELVMASCAAARTRLTELAGAGRGGLVIDLAAVPFVDSSGLSVLVAAYKAAQNAGRSLALAGVVAEVRALLELTRLHQVFAVYDDRDAALEQLDSNAA